MAKENGMEEKYIGQFYCYLRRDYFRWSEYIDFYKRDIQLKMLDPIGTVVELWDIKGAIITSATFGSLSYDATDLMKVSL